MPLGQAAGGAKPRRKPSGAKAFWTVDDFQFIGGYKLYAVNSPNSLTHRYINGQLYLYTFIYDAPNYRIQYHRPPSLSASPGSYQLPSVINNAGAVWNSGGKVPRGLYYDEVTDTWFATRHNDYDGAGQTPYLTPICSFNIDENHTAWSNQKYIWNRGMAVKGHTDFKPIPTEYRGMVGGKRVVCGFGGYYSIISQGYPGPVACAMDPQDIIDTPSGTPLIADELLFAHPHNANSGTPPYPGLRDRNAWTTNDGGATVNESGTDWQAHWPEGYAYMGVDFSSTAFWIETANKKGFCQFWSLGYDGTKATITNAVETSSTGSGANDNVSYTITLDQALPRAVAGTVLEIYMPNTIGLWNRSTISAIRNNGLEMDVTVDGSQQQNGLNRFQLDVGNYCYFGTLYHEGSVGPSFLRTSLYVYDPMDVINKVNPAVPTGMYEFLPPNRNAIGPRQNKTFFIAGCTYDETTQRLYVLDGNANIGVYQVAV